MVFISEIFISWSTFKNLVVNFKDVKAAERNAYITPAVMEAGKNKQHCLQTKENIVRVINRELIGKSIGKKM